MAAPVVARAAVVRFRVHRHELDRAPEAARDATDVALLDYGVQDTGPDGAAWALAVRGAPTAGADDIALAWTWRGAPHAYRRSDLGAVAVASAPLSEADAARRVFDAAKPLRAAGVPVLDALRLVARRLREIVSVPTPKGEASGALTHVLDEHYVRFCRPCGTTHIYEQPFRLAALQAGLELEAATSPPVLRRAPGLPPLLYGRLGSEATPRFAAVRNYLRFYGPARVGDAAAFLDAPRKDVEAHWPEDAEEVVVPDAGGPLKRYALAEDVELLQDAPGDAPAVRLIGPYDPYLQLRDRELLVREEARRKELWPVLGRPGTIVVGGEIAGTWRPRTAARKLTVLVEPWRPLSPRERADLGEQAERLAAFRAVGLGGVSLA